MAHEKTIIKLTELGYDNVININTPERSEVTIECFMFREGIVTEIQIKRLKAPEWSSNDSIIVKPLMKNAVLGDFICKKDIVIEIKERTYVKEYHIREAEKYDYITIKK